MKLDVLRKIIREEVKGAIQDELKEIQERDHLSGKGED